MFACTNMHLLQKFCVEIPTNLTVLEPPCCQCIRNYLGMYELKDNCCDYSFVGFFIQRNKLNFSSVVPPGMVPRTFCELSIIARRHFFFWLLPKWMVFLKEKKKYVTQISHCFCISSPHQCCSLLHGCITLSSCPAL